MVPFKTIKEKVVKQGKIPLDSRGWIFGFKEIEEWNNVGFEASKT